MKFAVLFLAALAAAAPPTVEDDKIVVTKNFFPKELVVYTGKHDIVEIVVPLNKINFDDDGNTEDGEHTLFFVEADIKDNGDKDYKGIYVLKGDKVKKVLDNGQCSTYAKEKIAYFGANDGVYKYNNDDQTATKFGTVTESVINMAVDPEHALVYYLTEDYVLYKYTEDETESSKVEAIKDARDITIDFDGNLFYYDGSNQFYTYLYNGEKIVKIEGLPEHPKKVQLIRVPVVINDAFAVIDGVLFRFKVDGTSESTGIEFGVLPTAFAPDMTVVVQWYGYNKKMYKYNIATFVADTNIDGEIPSMKLLSSELTNFFNVKKEEINVMKATKVSNKL